MYAMVNQRLEMREKRQRRQKKIHEEHAPHRDVVASTLGVGASAVLARIPRSLNEAKVATRETRRGLLEVFTFILELK
jgi:hypothetical protein